MFPAYPAIALATADDLCGSSEAPLCGMQARAVIMNDPFTEQAKSNYTTIKLIGFETNKMTT